MGNLLLKRTETFKIAQCVSKNICYFLPRNIVHSQVIALAGENGTCELEQCFLDDRLKCWNVYYGNLIKHNSQIN
jgi:hypothetical protein